MPLDTTHRALAFAAPSHSSLPPLPHLASVAGPRVWHPTRPRSSGLTLTTPSHLPRCYLTPLGARLTSKGQARAASVDGGAAALLKAAAAPTGTAAPELERTALLQAQGEGLTLVRSRKCKTGYRCVAYNPRYAARPFKVQVKGPGGRNVRLGDFAVAVEAALCYARYLGPYKSAEAAAAEEAKEALEEAKEAHRSLLMRSIRGSQPGRRADPGR